MTREELLAIAKDMNIEELCNYCEYEDGCPRDVRCYGGEPIFTPCADLEMEDYLNLDALNEMLEEEETQ